VKRPKPPFRFEISDADVVIGWLADLPEPAEPIPEPIRLQYSKASRATQSASRKGRGSRRRSASKAMSRNRSAAV
jgi:hypothetical protein